MQNFATTTNLNILDSLEIKNEIQADPFNFGGKKNSTFSPIFFKRKDLDLENTEIEEPQKKKQKLSTEPNKEKENFMEKKNNFKKKETEFKTLQTNIQDTILNESLSLNNSENENRTLKWIINNTNEKIDLLKKNEKLIHEPTEKYFTPENEGEPALFWKLMAEEPPKRPKRKRYESFNFIANYRYELEIPVEVENYQQYDSYNEDEEDEYMESNPQKKNVLSYDYKKFSLPYQTNNSNLQTSQFKDKNTKNSKTQNFSEFLNSSQKNKYFSPQLNSEILSNLLYHTTKSGMSSLKLSLNPQDTKVHTVKSKTIDNGLSSSSSLIDSQSSIEKKKGSKQKRHYQMWTEQEDEKLKTLVETGCSWKLIAEKMGNGRNADSCRLRWFNVLNPKLLTTPLTENEKKLIVAEKKKGKSAKEIFKMLGHRPYRRIYSFYRRQKVK